MHKFERSASLIVSEEIRFVALRKALPALVCLDKSPRNEQSPQISIVRESTNLA